MSFSTISGTIRVLGVPEQANVVRLGEIAVDKQKDSKNGNKGQFQRADVEEIYSGGA
jgi:hypothetical protein